MIGKKLHPALCKMGLAAVNNHIFINKKMEVKHLIDIMDKVNEAGTFIETTPDSEYTTVITHNGCGPCGWKRGLMKRIEKPFWLLFAVNFRRDCYGHDILYAIGGTEMDRARADLWLYESMVARCNRRFRWAWRYGIKWGELTARAFREAVQRCGRDAFNYWSEK